MYRHAIKYFDLSSFLSKRWNRITRLKRNDHTSVMHCTSHNKSYSSTLYRESMTIHSHYFASKKSSTQCFISVLVDPDSTLKVYWFFPNNWILLSVNTAYFISFINLFSSLWVLVSIQILVLTVHMLWFEYTTSIHYVWMMRFHWYRATRYFFSDRWSELHLGSNPTDRSTRD